MQAPSTPLDQAFDFANHSLEATERPPLTQEEIRTFREQLSAVPETQTAEPIRVRGGLASAISPNGLGVFIYNAVRESRAEGLQLADLAQLYYSFLVRNALTSTGYFTDQIITSLLTEDEAWTTNDLAAIRRLYEKSLELGESKLRRTPVNEVFVRWRVGDHLYLTEPWLRAEVDRYGIDWRVEARTASNIVGNDVERAEYALELIRQRVTARHETEVGPEAPATREANDRFDRQRGVLTANCDQWTYEELTYWVRFFARRASSRVVYDWLREYGGGFGIGFEFEGDPSAVDVESFAEVVDDLVQVASKRVLCALLATSGSQAPVWGRESFSWHNLTVVSPHLRTVVLESIQNEIRALEITPRPEVGPAFLETWDVDPADSGVGEEIATLGAVAEDIGRQLLPQFGGAPGLNVREDIIVETFDLDAIPRTVSIQPQYPRRLLAWVVLSGSTLVSLLAFRTEFEPVRLFLEAGDALVAQGSGYDSLIFRSHEGPSRLLRITISQTY